MMILKKITRHDCLVTVFDAVGAVENVAACRAYQDSLYERRTPFVERLEQALWDCAADQPQWQDPADNNDRFPYRLTVNVAGEARECLIEATTIR